MRRTRGLIGSLLLFALLALVLLTDLEGGQNGPGEPAEERGTRHEEPVRAFVTRVVDGDTVEVTIDGQQEDVRYIGIDTPETVNPGEPVQCFGPQSSAANKRLVEHRTVRLVFDRERRDVYGRLLAYVYAGDRFVNARLVRLGYARTLTIAPNVAHAGLFHRLARAAGRAGAGLWRAC
ncbi:MAG: thermonuclease family protein [Solirubrobacterales bacterium]